MSSPEPFNSADKAIEASQQDVFDPPYEAAKLRVTGMGWREVAEATGYASEVSCAVAVRSYLQNAALQEGYARKKEALTLELMRLDELQARWWTAAIKGDEKAAQIVLKVIGMRAKMLGVEEHDSEKATGNKTILVMGSNKDYSETLKEIVAGKHDQQEDEEE